MRKPYLIRTPEFEVTSGGIRVMYGLYAWLLAKGEVAYLNTKIDIPSIGIYPEIYHGNDMEASKVVRYILQTPGVMTYYGIPGPSTEEIKDTSDHIISFSKIYDTVGLKDQDILFLPILNLNVFKDYGNKRTKTCYLIGKGRNKQAHPRGSIELTRKMALDQKALADTLNECSVLYCYDRLSAMMEIARLCGCSVKYYGDFEYEDLQKYEPGMEGISYYGDKIQFNPVAFREQYKRLRTTFELNLDSFIERTQA